MKVHYTVTSRHIQTASGVARVLDVPKKGFKASALCKTHVSISVLARPDVRRGG